jgi:hypothetical protein
MSAFTGVAVGSAIVASSAADSARIDRCKVEIMQFDSKTASVQQMRSYSQCVETLYPDPMPASVIVVFKILFFTALLGATIGGWFSFKTTNNSLADILIISFLWFVSAPAALVLLSLLVLGISWLFT